MKHHDGKKFFNPTLPSNKDKSFWQGLRMWLSTPKAKWPKLVENEHKPNINPDLKPNQIAVTFINHVTFLLQLPGLNILTDPVWCKRASPFRWLGPARVRKPGIAFEDLPEIDLILISHNHYDHLDSETLAKFKDKSSTRICVPLGDHELVQSLGYKAIYELDWWETVSLDPNNKVTFTPMQHWSARSISDQYESLWGSYVIEHNDKKIFFGGDGGYCRHFSDIYDKIGAIDLAFIGIGSYEPRWFMQNMHTNPEEAVLIHLDLHSKLSIGMHFGTFQLSSESMQQPLIDLQTAKQKYNIAEENFITLQVGETKIIDL